MVSVNYLSVLKNGLALTSQINTSISTKKADDGKIDSKEAFDILIEVLPTLFDMIGPFIRTDV